MPALPGSHPTQCPSDTDLLSGRRVVVTGGAGFIGSHLTETAAAVAGRLVVIDDLSTGDIDNLSFALRQPNVRFVCDSILNHHALHDIFEEGDIIFHLAALPSVARSLQDPLTCDTVNVHGTLSVLQAATDTGAAHVVYASSSSVYGDSAVLSRVETAAPSPMSPYAVSKLAGECYCNVMARQLGLSVTVLRFFNVYGPRQNPCSQYSAVIPRFIDAAVSSRPLTVYGDGEQCRDFTYVEDVVSACLLAAASRPHGVFNVATGRTISVNNLAGSILAITGSSSSIRHLSERPGDVRDSAADISRLRALGYQPQFTLQQGLETTVQWMRTRLHMRA